MSDLLDCPFCPNQGWYPQGNPYDGTAEQVQCEFCWTNEKSKFYNWFLADDKARKEYHYAKKHKP